MCAYYEFAPGEVGRYVEDEGVMPTGDRCNAVAAGFDEMMRGWVCESHANVNACLRKLLPPDVAELALLLANADLNDDALEIIVGSDFDEKTATLEAFLTGRNADLARGSLPRHTGRAR